jgi:ubiquinone/menaquinone biosynthesis C-methylase UbiE
MSGPSLEKLIENADIGIEILHPGGLGITRELAELCHIARDSRVLDVASGTGESACFLAETFGCRVTGVDLSGFMIERARRKALERGLEIEFLEGNAHELPFEADTFDAVISECTVCLLDKERAIREMARVVRSGAYMGIHDICWKSDAPESMKQRLAEMEGERPETLQGWNWLFDGAGLIDVITVDKSELIREWSNEVERMIGFAGKMKIFFKALRLWGPGGLSAILKSERIFRSEYMGYGIIVGRKP